MTKAQIAEQRGRDNDHDDDGGVGVGVGGGGGGVGGGGVIVNTATTSVSLSSSSSLSSSVGQLFVPSDVLRGVFTPYMRGYARAETSYLVRALRRRINDTFEACRKLLVCV
jgi:hypothetical protein